MCITQSVHQMQHTACHNIININLAVSRSTSFPFDVCFRDAVSCVSLLSVRLPFILPGGQASSCMCQFAIIISICSHSKRLVNPRSHASNAPRIICVCFLTRRRDWANLLGGGKREGERWRETEGKRDRCLAHKLGGGQETNGTSEGEIRRKTRDK